MTLWHEDHRNAAHLSRLRSALADGGRLLVFVGAGVSFGAARQFGRASFDSTYYRDWQPFDSLQGLADDDDGLPLPSWPWLISRMYSELAMQTSGAQRRSLRTFFIEEGALDCAQLYRHTVGEASYREFLLQQFDSSRVPFVAATPAHAALVALNLPLLFTTNYDELIEQAHLAAAVPIRTSATEDQFKAHIVSRPARHLVKLHGSIDQPDSIVLTRNDYAASRNQRREMFSYLRGELASSTFLFVGFSLSDPNFGLLHDDIRAIYGMNRPVSYTVQGRRDPIKERYLASLDVQTVWLDGWNDLPNFLNRLRAETGQLR